MVLKSALLEEVPGVFHGFGTHDEPVAHEVINLWSKESPIWKQVHGSGIAWVKTPRQNCAEVDAFFSALKNVPIGIATADCVPILLAHREGTVIAAVHAGWKGTLARILRTLWKEIQIQTGESTDSADWIAAIGPAIGPCCYEVSEELAQSFRHKFEDLGSDLAVPKNRILDLPAIHAAELRHLGFKQIDLMRVCTRCCSAPLFNSYRRDSGALRQYSVIMKTDDHQSC
jgi:YfiH family protein